MIGSLLATVNKLKGQQNPKWDEASKFDSDKDKTNFRKYEEACDRVKNFYREQHGSSSALILTVFSVAHGYFTAPPCLQRSKRSSSTFACAQSSRRRCTRGWVRAWPFLPCGAAR